MASLTITISGQSVSVSMADAKALALITDVVEATDGPVSGTARQKAAWVLRECADHLRTIQRRAIHARKEATVRTELDTELEAAGDWADV